MTQNKTLQTIDHETGEVTEQEPEEGELLIVSRDMIIAEMEAGIVPLYIRKMQELQIPEEEKEPLLSLYTGQAPRKLDDYYNTTVEIIGGAILYHGPYQGKDGLPHKGYFFLALLTTERDNKGNLVVLKTSSSGSMVHFAYALAQRGWFLWQEPVQYLVTRGEDGSHRFRNVSRIGSLDKVLTAKKGK